MKMRSLTKYVLILSVAVSLIEAANNIVVNPEPQLRSFQETSGIAPFIIDGLPAADGQFPWQAAIISDINGKGGFCGGSLISDQWILTAAHCVPSLGLWDKIICVLTNLFTFSVGKCYTTNFQIKVGSVNLGIGGKVVKTTQATVHPNYSTKTLEHDIALIKLNEVLPLSDTIKPIELSNETLSPDESVIVSGWGKTNDSASSVSNDLNYVTMNIISNDQCNTQFGIKIAGDLIVCAVGAQSKNPCLGDSGGPLVKKTADGETRHVGVVSFVSALGCEVGLPSGYSRTEPHIPWIKEQIKKK